MRIALLPLLILTACNVGEFTPNPDYCGLREGDAYCGSVAPDKPFCVLGRDECLDASGIDASDAFGCVAEEPALECRQPCGEDGGDDCLDPTDPTLTTTTMDESSSTGEPTTGETETGDESSSTTGPECTDIIPCLDAEAPFCVEGACSTCEASVDPTPDEACAGLDEGFPLCVGTACVQCSAEDASACGGDTPLCDAASNTCVGCSFHEECQELGMPACNIATGACFSADDAATVSLATANALQNAVNDVPDGGQRALLITGSGATNHSATVGGGKTIAIVSMNTSIQEINGAAAPIVTVSGATSTVYLHRVRLEGSNDVGISVVSGATLYADSVQVAGNDGGGIELASGTNGFLRNSMVAGFGGNPGVPAISASGAEVDILYSTVGLPANFGGAPLECSGGAVSVRNSIVVNENNTPGNEVDCPGSTVENSRLETTLSPTDWFGAGFASGNYFLNTAGQTEFANAATWELGDPPFDFEGDLRPTEDGTMDFAGADVP